MNAVINGKGLMCVIQGLKMFHTDTVKMSNVPGIDTDALKAVVEQEKLIVDTYNALLPVMKAFGSQEELNAAEIFISAK